MTLKHIVGLFAGSVGARFAGAALGLLSQIILARLLSPADLGTALLAMSAAAFFSLAVIGGHAMLGITHLPRLAAHGRQHLVAAFHGTVLRECLLIAAAVLAVAVTAFIVLPMTKAAQTVLVFGLLAAPGAALMRYNSVAANSLRRFQLAYLPDFLVRPGLFFLILAALWSGSGATTLGTVLVVFVILLTAVALGQAWVLGRDGLMPATWHSTRPLLVKRMRSRALALMVVSAVVLAFADIVTLVSGFVLPHDKVAVVGITVRLAALAGFILQASHLLILPDLTQALVRRDDAKANAMLWRVNLITVGVIGAALLAALLLGKFALRLFGESYVAGASLLVLLLVGQSVRALSGMNQHILSINGHQVRTAAACLLALGILVLMAVLLCPHLGMIGIGYAVIAAELAWLLALAAQANKLCNRRGDLLWLARNASSHAGGH